ncbi:hypothetical protein EJ06DRAFT_482495 [Trichodelitschia bisporula]|uniref:Histone-lysine N-methyltransferase, H3 lysine-36 specific n=1 Tax=Trichodelitschia bisporula TaxID=703511 RepID=A0A6G1HMD6_9PEZI|nr:hypothetical protein EJ06DRAFT_482495 [Trichodelitschia bisporula]
MSPRSRSPSLPAQQELKEQSPSIKLKVEDTDNNTFEQTSDSEPIKVERRAPKLSRTTSGKAAANPPTLFLEEPDMYKEATSSFEVITDCSYAAKGLAKAEEASECECRESWDASTGHNGACSEHDDCINRMLKIECTGNGLCGKDCQNRRFQKKQYGDVSVFKTEKKGYGLRANVQLHPNDFIFEYIGEVIDEARFRKRMRQYDNEGIKHFYFMSIKKDEFIDATRKGNLGRFCNHSCSPNCYVDKWVVGNKQRMGIFALREIIPGEELVFDYNVDRYGADPQPCYCGEPNCTGFIGGKTQTERATKLSDATIEALGIDDGDNWDTVVSKKPKRARKAKEEDEDYVNTAQAKELEQDGVTNVIATLMQCTEKWIAVKLLNRIQRSSDNQDVMYRILQMHGYRAFKIVLGTFMDDANVCLQVLGLLKKLPRLSRNKIEKAKIEETVVQLKTHDDELVVAQSAEILEEWSNLTTGYRIQKRDPKTVPTESAYARERRQRSPSPSRNRTRTRSVTPPSGPSAPTGPRNNVPQRNHFNGPRPFRRPPPVPLPSGWFQAIDVNGKVYYYTSSGQTTWARPTEPVVQAPPKPSHNERLQQIINECIKATVMERTSGTTTPKALDEEPVKPKPKKEEKWKSLSLEKQQKLYENTLFPHIKPVVDKFRKKLPRDDLKRLAKEVSKILMEKDYKKGRVTDPTRITDKQAKAVRQFTTEFFQKAVVKHAEHLKRKAERAAKKDPRKSPAPKEASMEPSAVNTPDSPVFELQKDIEMSDDEDMVLASRSDSPAPGKRSRSVEDNDDEPNTLSAKKQRLSAPPPPPPPPPPAEDVEPEDDAVGFVKMNGWKAAEVVKQEPSPADTDTNQDADGENIGRTTPVHLATPLTADYEGERKLNGHKVSS